MTMYPFQNQRILVVGGAGFVGSNLVHSLLEQDPKEVVIVDNLLSSDISNVPLDPRVNFVFGSITDDQILAGLPGDLDYAFHLACYHGNQSSIHDPLADHDNNTLTSLKLFERLSHIKSLKKVVYAAAACAVAEKTYENPTATTEEQPVTLFHDSPYRLRLLVSCTAIITINVTDYPSEARFSTSMTTRDFRCRSVAWNHPYCFRMLYPHLFGSL